MNKQIGTKVFWVQTGGFDTHAIAGRERQGAYVNLMATLGDGLKAFYDDLNAQGMLNNTVVLVYSEFGRRISENGSQGTDHGAGGNMMVLGGLVRGGIYGTAPNLNMDPANPTLENSSGRREVRNRLPRRLREDSRQLAGSELGRDSRRGLSSRRAEHSLEVSRVTRLRDSFKISSRCSLNKPKPHASRRLASRTSSASPSTR